MGVEQGRGGQKGCVGGSVWGDKLRKTQFVGRVKRMRLVSGSGKCGAARRGRRVVRRAGKLERESGLGGGAGTGRAPGGRAAVALVRSCARQRRLRIAAAALLASNQSTHRLALCPVLDARFRATAVLFCALLCTVLQCTVVYNAYNVYTLYTLHVHYVHSRPSSLARLYRSRQPPLQPPRLIGCSALSTTTSSQPSAQPTRFNPAV